MNPDNLHCSKLTSNNEIKKIKLKNLLNTYNAIIHQCFQKLNYIIIKYNYYDNVPKHLLTDN